MTTQPPYVLMPAVATEEMIEAAEGALSEWRKTLSRDEAMARSYQPNGQKLFLASATPKEKHAIRYAAMVAARPHPAGELKEADAVAFLDFCVRHLCPARRHEISSGEMLSIIENHPAVKDALALLNAGAPPVGEGKQGVISSVARAEVTPSGASDNHNHTGEKS